MPRRTNGLSRRQFMRRTLGSGAAISLGGRLAGSGPSGETSEDGRIEIHAGAPAGPAPYGAPAELSVPFAPGHLPDAGKLTILAPSGKPVLAQFRPALSWPDGSIRWLVVAFEPEAGPGDYILKPGDPCPGPELVRTENGRVRLDTGEMVLTLSDSGAGLEVLAAPNASGEIVPIMRGGAVGDLLLTRHDGKIFRASLGAEEGKLIVEEKGPVRGSVRLERPCRAEDGEHLFDSIIRCVVYRGRPELFLTVTWIDATDRASQQVRDIRLHFPFDFEPQRLVIGCDRGVYDGPFLKDRPTYVLQDDDDRYVVKELTTEGRTLNLSSGGCNGAQAPGWLYIRNRERCLGIWIPNFWEEYPNELTVGQSELSVGLWPERAIDHLLSKPLLPANPQGTPYVMTRYWPILPHPYWAFIDPGKKCLDARQGMAKTQEIVLSVWAGRGEMPPFERKWWAKSLQPVRAHLEPAYVTGTGALGQASPRDARTFPAFEKLFDESFGWLDRHIDLQKCYGKFDYGDFRYFTAATDYLCSPGTKWGEMGEMPREGYWHNNERDPLLGMLLYYYRSGDPVAWNRCAVVARHLLDADIRHFPHWGMWTHSYGHSYVALGEAGEPDHSWLLGLLVWCGASGDPVAWDWLKRCGEKLRSLKMDFSQTDARTAAVFLHMMCQFYQYTGEPSYLKAGRAPAEAFLRLQNINGSWPAYLGNLKQPRLEGFVEHVVMALADYYSLRPDGAVRKSLDRALVYLFGEDGDKKPDEGESPLALYGLAQLAAKTGENKYAAVARKVLDKLCASQNLSPDPMGRADMMAQWGVNNSDGAKETGRPAQFLGQTRPLIPSSILAYGSPAVAAIARNQAESNRNPQKPSHVSGWHIPRDS